VLRVLSCVYVDHDWRLVLLAAGICVTAVMTSFRLFGLVMASSGRLQQAWLWVTGVVAAAGIWATHFVAMLAYQPHLKTGYLPGLTLLSLVEPTVTCALGFWIAVRWRRRSTVLLGGGVLGLGIAVMHFTGMAAFRTQGVLLWHPAYVAASIAIGAGLGALALLAAGRSSTLKRQIAGAGALTLAICGMHFTAMSAVSILPNPSAAVPQSVMSNAAMAVAVTVLAALIIAAAVAAGAIEASSRKSGLQRLADAIDAMPDGLIFYDADDRIIAWNRRFEEMIGEGANLLVAGLPYETFLREVTFAGGTPEAIGREEAWIAERLAQRRQDRSTVEQSTPDGGWLRIDDRRTREGGIVSVFVDITDLKRSEAEMAHARDAAEAANRAKSEFLANMSHEIRTPMNGIIGMNGLLLASELNDRQRKFAQAVQFSAGSLLDIINDILDISKLEAGQVRLESLAVDIETVVEDVVELASPRATEKTLDLAAFVAPSARGTFLGDPTRLRQVLLNLVSNAVKFTEQGHVGVRVIGWPDGQGCTRLRVEVQDTGIGLTPEARGNLFQKFQQADGSITRRFGGTGLGLSISRELVELMGGSIGVDDRPGGGSVFWFEVALAPEPGGSVAPPTRLDGVRVRLCSPRPLGRQAWQALLQDAGAVVETIEEADAASAAQANLILVDECARDWAAAGAEGRTAARAAKRVLIQPLNQAGEALGDGYDAVITLPVRRRAAIATLAGLWDAEQAAPDATGAPEPETRGGEGHILLAEDNDINALLATTLLEAAGYQVTRAEDGARAVQAARDGDFGLILMDVQMPVLDGLQATRLIRSLGGARAATPIVALTANAMRADRDACLGAGMDDFITKPIVAEVFLEKVARRLALGSARPGAEEDAADEILDLNRLGRLARLMSRDELEAMALDHLRHMEGLLDRMQVRVRDGDLAGLRSEAHACRGAWAEFGGQRAQRLASALERACRGGDRDQAIALAAEVRSASQAAADRLEAELAARPLQRRAV
jgi:PAS domain S-box-containing protein